MTTPTPTPRLALEIAAAALLLATYAYSIRKWFEASLHRRRARAEERGEAAIEQMRAAIATLQTQVHAGRITRRPEVLEAARHVIAKAGLRGVFSVEVTPGGPLGWLIQVEPHAPFGSLDAWLVAHAAAAIAAVPVVLFHARFALGGPLTAALLLAFLASAATGLIAGYLRWVGPGGAELGTVAEQLARLDADLAHTVPGSPRDQVLRTERARILAARGPAIARKRLLDACLVAHVPLAAAAFALAILHVVTWWYY